MTLKEKIKNLNSYWDELKNDPYKIHDIYFDSSTVIVLWSDDKGYSVSYNGIDGIGCCGIHKTIIEAAEKMKRLINFKGIMS